VKFDIGDLVSYNNIAPEQQLGSFFLGSKPHIVDNGIGVVLEQQGSMQSYDGRYKVHWPKLGVTKWHESYELKKEKTNESED
tara:strand:- start:685 stop:930 length:246 start_codon:yes stop_codon:yes gene_type:complete